MDFINKGINKGMKGIRKTIRKPSTLSESPSISRTPSITNSVTSEESNSSEGDRTDFDEYAEDDSSYRTSMSKTLSNDSISIHKDKKCLYPSVTRMHAPLSPYTQSNENEVDNYFSLSTNPSNGDANRMSQYPDRTFKSDNEPNSELIRQGLSRLTLNYKPKRKNYRKLNLNDFKLKCTIGTGSFGRVHLAQSRVNNRHYAIKAVEKYNVVRLKRVDHINNEPTILREIAHPFLITLWDAFQDDTHLFMVMEYASGGELFSILKQKKKFSEEDAKFYSAEIVLALTYLHSKNIVYRDLKPENILIDATGHIKLTDFGFAKRIDKMTWTVCGTPDYIAPEIILSRGYTKAVDWWGLGVLLFEMITGRAPFQDSNPINLYQKILECQIDWPEDISESLKDLLQNLLTSDLKTRFDGDNVIQHPWFEDMDFDALMKGEIKPPFIPDIKSDDDTAHFAKYKEPVDSYGTTRSDPFKSKFPAF